MAEATLTISSRNYSSWSLRGWLLCRMAGLDFEESMVPIDDPSTRAELLLLSPSFLVPCLTHDGVKVWDTLAIAEYLNEAQPGRRAAARRTAARRAHCRAISRRDAFGLQQPALGAADEPQGALPGFKVWAGAQADIDRIDGDLARMPGDLRRAVPVRRAPPWPTRCTRRCARASSPTTCKLDARLRRLLRRDHGAAGDGANGSRPPGTSRRKSKSSTWSSEPRFCSHRQPGRRRPCRCSAPAASTGSRTTPKSRVLEIWFQGSTGPYRFLDVPQDVADGLRQAGSAMAYFDEHIRDRYGVR